MLPLKYSEEYELYKLGGGSLSYDEFALELLNKNTFLSGTPNLVNDPDIPTPNIEVLSKMPEVLSKIDLASGLTSDNGFISELPDVKKNLAQIVQSKGFNYALLAVDLTNNVLAATGLDLKLEYEGKHGDITKGMDAAYDLIQSTVGNFGPVGKVIGLAMGANKALNSVANKLGAGTDAMTKKDAILSSSFLGPVGWINGWTGSKADTILKDDFAFETVGASYGATEDAVNSALERSGKKYGGISQNEKRVANQRILDAKILQDKMALIADEKATKDTLMESMAEINANRRELELNGGLDPNNIRAAKEGMSFSSLFELEDPNTIEDFSFENPDNIATFAQGGSLIEDSDYENFVETLPENLRNTDSKLYNLHLMWELNGRPKEFNEIKGTIATFNKKDKLWHLPSVAYDEDLDIYIFLKSPEHPSFVEELKWYFTSPEAEEFRSNWDYDPVKYIYKRKKNSKELVVEFQKGGSFNVVPDGSLHARKHNMDIEGITNKGIPVVSENSNGELTLQAEIEKEEVILRLEVTKRLEELNKENTDDAAIEAGKLLVHELLYNTKDNTNNII